MTDSVLVVVAHPDDAEFHFGATVAKLVSSGADVHYLVCTDGVMGSDDVDAPDDRIAATRRAEQRAAAAVLGVSDVTFLGLPDGRLEPDEELRRTIVQRIRTCKPRLVITHFPQRVLHIPIEASHPDHVVVGEVTLRAVYPDAGSPRAFPELRLEAHHVTEVWVPGYQRADHFVDATSFLDKKTSAILCHESQLGDPVVVPEWVYGWMSEAGREHGYAYAEHFKRIML